MGEHICFRRNERLATVNPHWRGNPVVRGKFVNRQHRFRPGMGECVEVASFAQSAAEREKECEVESQVELSAFAGWRGRQFTDLARA